MRAFVAVDTDEAVAFYERLEPLFSQAFAELGYPDRRFDQVLEEAITQVLAAPELEGPFQLVRPSVMYRYADEELENLSKVEKLLLQMRPENAAQLKAKLAAFRDALAARG